MPQKLLPTQLAHRHRLDRTLSSLSSLPLLFSLLLSLLFFFCLFSSTEKNPILRGFAPQHGRTRSAECWLLNGTARGSGRSTQTGGHSVQTGGPSMLWCCGDERWSLHATRKLPCSFDELLVDGRGRFNASNAADKATCTSPSPRSHPLISLLPSPPFSLLPSLFSSFERVTLTSF